MPAKNNVWTSWIVDTAVYKECIPASGKRFTCGAPGTNTRCVCSHPIIHSTECKCQYWPPEDVGAHSPAFCTGYYVGGTSGISGHGVHHWACCNNCDDPTPNTCDGKTWQGGSSIKYCNSCGQNTGGGQVEYYFNCESCDKQQACAEECSTFINNRKGFCWKWLGRFKGCCLETSQPHNRKRDVSELSFCGDGICSETETPASCHADCCYQMNSENCTKGLDNCSPQCCNEPNCCLENKSNNSGNGSSKSATIAVCVTLLIAILVSSIATVIIYYRKKNKRNVPTYNQM